MKYLIVIALALVTTAADASYDCVTRRSGSTTITTCGSGKTFSQCRSYYSGRTLKTSCRS